MANRVSLRLRMQVLPVVQNHQQLIDHCFPESKYNHPDHESPASWDLNLETFSCANNNVLQDAKEPENKFINIFNLILTYLVNS